jgi:cyclophilin family peptidyl-prolyl cis-trans isomerase
MSVWLVAVVCVAGFVAMGCSASGDANRAPGGKQASSQPAKAGTGNPVVVIETSMGAIKAELWADKAPITAANFLRYTDEGFFNGLIVHRVVEGFMMQGGGYTVGMKKRAGHEPIRNEASPQLKNLRGTLAMARTGVVDSATSEFFINFRDNVGLDQTGRTREAFGYCAFGKVIEGMDVVDRIAKVNVKLNPGMGEVSQPVETIEIRSIHRAE